MNKFRELRRSPVRQREGQWRECVNYKRITVVDIPGKVTVRMAMARLCAKWKRLNGPDIRVKGHPQMYLGNRAVVSKR